MDKAYYFNISKKRNTSIRCPYYEKCSRFQDSIYYLYEMFLDTDSHLSIKDKLVKEGIIASADNEIISEIELPFHFRESKNTYELESFCPEVPLFYSDKIHSFIPGKPIVSGWYDSFEPNGKYGKDNKFKIHREMHFTDCSEFKSTSLSPSGKKKKRRIPISKQLRFEVLQKSNFSCTSVGDQLKTIT